MGSTIGQNIKITLFGESHGPVVGITIDGLKSGIKLDHEYIKNELIKRAPTTPLSTKRHESNDYEIISGCFNGYTTGTPLTIIFKNEDIKTGDYKPNMIRPGHADYTAFLKYNGYQDYRGGGHFSGRLTAPLVACGAICKKILEEKNIFIGSHVKQIKDVVDVDFAVNKNELSKQINYVNSQPFATISPLVKEQMIECINAAKNENDSVGGIIESAVLNVEGGIGEPFFHSIESVLSSLIFSIPGVKGVEFGKGFEFASLMGSVANDQFSYQEGIKILSNNNGGINGGISNGMPIIIKTAIKPTPSIGKEQSTVDLLKNKTTLLKLKGRYDPCIVSRACVILDSVIAIGLLDLYIERYGYEWM